MDYSAQQALRYWTYRPSYPECLVERSAKLLAIDSSTKILEVGCGPGTLTTAFGNLGCEVTGLEPSRAMFDLAMRNCRAYRNVKLQCSSLSSWSGSDLQFDILLAGTSLHWVVADKRTKLSRLLKPNGSLVAFWNFPAEPDEVFRSTYARNIGAELPYNFGQHSQQRHFENVDSLTEHLITSGEFKIAAHESTCRGDEYSCDDFFRLLCTMTPYIGARNSTLTHIRESLEATCRQLGLCSITTRQVTLLRILTHIL